MSSPITKDVKIICGDAGIALSKVKDKINLVYIDPPFNTGRKMTYTKIKTSRESAIENKGRNKSKNQGENNKDFARSTSEGTPHSKASRIGFGENNYHTEVISKIHYDDKIEDYHNFILDKVAKAYKLLTANASFFLHLDYREVHYLKVKLDDIFGRQNFINEIIWSYDYGARATSKWSCKHDTILWYAVNRDDYVFNYEEIDRIPYMAPALVGPEKAARGKTPTDVWWNSIAGTNSAEREAGQGYPTQKPLNILERIIKVHSNPGDRVLDFFAGSGTTGVAALKHKRKAILIDKNKEAIKIIKHRIKTLR